MLRINRQGQGVSYPITANVPEVSPGFTEAFGVPGVPVLTAVLSCPLVTLRVREVEGWGERDCGVSLGSPSLGSLLGDETRREAPPPTSK
jgi:hypothetical protein